ncbi:MAG: hypothetical protein AAF722_20515 [Cyanobacteria bacterium P01_C01_bin.70]
MRALLAQIRSALKKMPLQSMIAAGLAAMMLLVTPMTVPLVNASVSVDLQSRLDELKAKGREGRPRTTGQFNAEKEALEGQFGEVMKRMRQETAEAAEEAIAAVRQNLKDLRQDLLPEAKVDSLPMEN